MSRALICTIVTDLSRSTKDELQALEAHLQVLTISNRDLSQSNKSLSDTIAAISRTSLEPMATKADTRSILSANNAHGASGGLHLTSFIAMPAGNSVPTRPQQPEPYVKATDHLQRCMKSVQELAKTISCALNALHGHKKIGSSDVHGSYAKLAANLDQLSRNVQCVHCQREIALSHFEPAKDHFAQAGVCVCVSQSSPLLWALGAASAGSQETVAPDDSTTVDNIEWHAEYALRAERQQGNRSYKDDQRLNSDSGQGQISGLNHETDGQEMDANERVGRRRGALRPDQKQRVLEMRREVGDRLLYNDGPHSSQDLVPTIKAPASKRLSSNNPILEDYQTQLRDLEAQNKRRLLMARQDQDNALASPVAPAEADISGITNSAPIDIFQPLTGLADSCSATIDEHGHPLNHPMQTQMEQQRQELVMFSRRQQQMVAMKSNQLNLQQRQVSQNPLIAAGEEVRYDRRRFAQQDPLERPRATSSTSAYVHTAKPSDDGKISKQSPASSSHSPDITKDWNKDFDFEESDQRPEFLAWHSLSPSGLSFDQTGIQECVARSRDIPENVEVEVVDPSLIQAFEPLQSSGARRPSITAIQSRHSVGHSEIPSPVLPCPPARSPRPLGVNVRPASSSLLAGSGQLFRTFAPSDGTSMKLNFKDLKQQRFTIDAETTDTIASVKAKISAEKGWDPSTMKLIYGGRILQDNDRIEASEVEEEDFIVCMTSKPKAAPNPACAPSTGQPQTQQAGQVSWVTPSPMVSNPMIEQHFGHKRSHSDAFLDSVSDAATLPPPKRRPNSSTPEPSEVSKSSVPAIVCASDSENDKTASSSMSAVQALLSRWVDSSAVAVLLRDP